MTHTKNFNNTPIRSSEMTMQPKKRTNLFLQNEISLNTFYITHEMARASAKLTLFTEEIKLKSIRVSSLGQVYSIRTFRGDLEAVARKLRRFNYLYIVEFS